jgi:hypothetical protein
MRHIKHGVIRTCGKRIQDELTLFFWIFFWLIKNIT